MSTFSDHYKLGDIHATTPHPSNHILVVDDDEGVREGLKRHLTRAGFKATTASDGIEAITICNTREVNLIILDVKMPGIDGFEVCTAIKKTHAIPIIFLTGAQDSIVRNYLPHLVNTVGGDYFLRKPFDINALLHLVREVIHENSNRHTS